MADIKVKQSKRGTVKTIDKAIIGTEKMKDRLVQAKDKTREVYQEESNNNGTEYAINKITKNMSNTPDNIYKTNKIGKNKFKQSKENLYNMKRDIGTYIKKSQRRKKIKQRARNIRKIRKNTIKTAKTTIKTADRTIKGAKKTAKATVQTTKRTIQATKEAVRATIKAIKITVKATIVAIKAIIAGAKALVSAIVAGGWIAVIIIIVVCVIGMVIYNFTGEGNSEIVIIALGEVGNVGGEPYWKWYGFTNRVEWCACFVSWCANECGYIEKEILPRFSAVGDGIAWFKENQIWQEENYFAKSGDIIFFDWENDGSPDHVGIVEKIDTEKIYTIEGNSNDICKRKEYDIKSNFIFGYGTPVYQ